MEPELNFDLDEALALLARTPGVLRAAMAGLDGPWLTAGEGPGTFSARDVLAHLIHAERTDWMPRVRHLLAHGETAPFPPFDREGFLAEARTWSLDALLDAFAQVRAEGLAELAGLGLSAADLERTGHHPTFGAVTLRNLLATWVVHDLGHQAQAARVMAKRYKADVGPWVEFLPVLTRR